MCLICAVPLLWLALQVSSYSHCFCLGVYICISCVSLSAVFILPYLERLGRFLWYLAGKAVLDPCMSLGITSQILELSLEYGEFLPITSSMASTHNRFLIIDLGLSSYAAGLRH